MIYSQIFAYYIAQWRQILCVVFFEISTALNFIKFFYTFLLPILCNLCFDRTSERLWQSNFELNVKFSENNAEKAFDVIKWCVDQIELTVAESWRQEKKRMNAGYLTFIFLPNFLFWCLGTKDFLDLEQLMIVKLHFQKLLFITIVLLWLINKECTKIDLFFLESCSMF